MLRVLRDACVCVCVCVYLCETVHAYKQEHAYAYVDTAKDGALPLVHPMEAKEKDARVMYRLSPGLYRIPPGSIEIRQVAEGLEVECVSCAPDDTATDSQTSVSQFTTT